MPSDVIPPPPIGPDHQLPAPESRKPGRPKDGSRPARPKRRFAWLIVWLLLLLLLAIGVLLFLRHQQAEKKAEAAAKKPPPGIAITTTTARKGSIGIYLDSIGTVTPVHTASLTSQVDGRIVTVSFTEGQLVKQGDPLIEIDPRPYQSTLLQAQGALERDQNILAQARMDLDRYRTAWARNAIAKQILDDQEKLVLQDEGTVKDDEGTVQYDKIQVEFCTITAPFSGRVGLRLVDPGNVVQAASSTTLAVVTELQPITVVFTIPEDNIGEVAARLNQKAKLPVDAFDRTNQTRIGSGALLTLDNQIDTTTGTVKGRAEFANSNNALFPNQFVNTHLLVNTLQGVTLLPSSTVQQNGQTSFVYVIQGDIAHMRTVKPGVSNGGVTQVSGVNPGEIVADSSFDKLQDNAKIQISNTPASTKSVTGRPGNSPAGGSSPK